MKKQIVLRCIMGFLLFSTISCTTNEDVENSLRGEWVEIAPVSDRSILIFSSENRLKRIDGEGNEENYIYRIDGDSIFLSLASGEEGSTELYFKKVDPGRFRIGNLYPSIPESEEIIMVFERI